MANDDYPEAVTPPLHPLICPHCGLSLLKEVQPKPAEPNTKGKLHPFVEEILARFTGGIPR